MRREEDEMSRINIKSGRTIFFRTQRLVSNLILTTWEKQCQCNCLAELSACLQIIKCRLATKRVISVFSSKNINPYIRSSQVLSGLGSGLAQIEFQIAALLQVKTDKHRRCLDKQMSG